MALSQNGARKDGIPPTTPSDSKLFYGQLCFTPFSSTKIRLWGKTKTLEEANRMSSKRHFLRPPATSGAVKGIALAVAGQTLQAVGAHRVEAWPFGSFFGIGYI